MESLRQGYNGLSMLIELNWDRLLFLGTLALALGAGAFFGAL